MAGKKYVACELKGVYSIRQLDGAKEVLKYVTTVDLGLDGKIALKAVLRFLKKTSALLYTQVGAGRSVVYVKGNKVVNRTGVYALVWAKELRRVV